MKSLWISEYGRLFKGIANRQRKSENDWINAELTEDTFDEVLNMFDDEDSVRFDEIFERSRKDGIEQLQVKNYVGVIQTPFGCQIEILPKTSKLTSRESAREILVKMLMELRDTPFKEGVLSNLEAHKMPLFELILRQFLYHVHDIVRKGIARKYVNKQDNLVYLRGKLQLNEHIKRNIFEKSRFFCEFDEYEQDRPINRLIKGALEIVGKLTRDPVNQQKCREFLFWFSHVPSTKDYRSDFGAIKQDRFVQHYQKAMPVCRRIFEGLNPLTKQGENKAFSMLFDMNRVFEEFVGAKLPVQFPDWKVNPQVFRYSIVEKHRGQSIFRLIPDFEFVRGSQCVIADTKWKLIDVDSKNYNISQSDIYQMFAYKEKYLAKRIEKVVILIFPSTDRFKKPIEPFYFDRDMREKLYVLPFDLQEGRLVTPTNSILMQTNKHKKRFLEVQYLETFGVEQ